jgi:hypothetical protein
MSGTGGISAKRAAKKQEEKVSVSADRNDNITWDSLADGTRDRPI